MPSDCPPDCLRLASRWQVWPIVRRGLRIAYAALLLLSVLWIIPLTFEAALRWWQEEALVYLQASAPGCS